METAEAQANGSKTGKKPQGIGEQKVKTPRRKRPAPAIFSAEQIKAPICTLPKVAQQSIPFTSKSLRIHSTFALTPDGEAMYVKLNKSTAVRLNDRFTFDGEESLLVYPYVW